MNGETNQTQSKALAEAQINYEYPPDIAYAPQSEARVVKLLILNRSTIDKGYGLNVYSGEDLIEESSGTPVQHEDIVCTYIDLDRLIEACDLSTQQRLVVVECMKGYAQIDIAYQFQITRQSVDTALRTAIEKIVRKNDEGWREAMQRRFGTIKIMKEGVL